MKTPAPPWALLAELTHACPLHCGYCSNPLELTRRSAELTTDEWINVFRQAGELGVLHTHLSGGEPLLRPDLPALVAGAVQAGIYTQLVTSGSGLNHKRLTALTQAGLHSVQLSVQHADPDASDKLAGARAFGAKETAASLIRESGLPLGVNVVLHRHNLAAIDGLVELALRWGAERLELANTQFYGWGLLNRDALLPMHEQLAHANDQVENWRERLGNRMEIVWVVPDYFEGSPKPCMGGWGAVSLTVAPDGAVLPCPAAAALISPDSVNVRDRSLQWIWEESPAFNRYRGTDWMPEPCQSCELRNTDFGGCRCQAFALTGDGGRTDPACSLSPDHALITQLAERPRAGRPALISRRPGTASARP